jgi:ribosomal protein L16/L10AE
MIKAPKVRTQFIPYKRKIKKNLIIKDRKALKFGSYGLQSISSFKMTFAQAESVRRTFSFRFKRCTKV